jgi:predicted ester cyclase
MVDRRQTAVFRWLAAGDAGDFDAFDELLHRDVVVHAPLGLSTATIDDEKAVWRDALAAMPDLRHEVQEVVVEDEIEMARVVVTGTMAASFAGVEGSGRSFQSDSSSCVPRDRDPANSTPRTAGWIDTSWAALRARSAMS